MGEQITVRVPDGLSKRLEYVAKRAGVKKSEIAREALSEYLASKERLSDARPIDKVRNLIGSVSSGEPDLGEGHRERLIELLKHPDA